MNSESICKPIKGDVIIESSIANKNRTIVVFRDDKYVEVYCDTRTKPAPVVIVREKVVCECGCKVAPTYLPRHRNTKKHAALMKTLTSDRVQCF